MKAQPIEPERHRRRIKNQQVVDQTDGTSHDRQLDMPSNFNGNSRGARRETSKTPRPVHGQRRLNTSIPQYTLWVYRAEPDVEIPTAISEGGVPEKSYYEPQTPQRRVQ